MPQKKPDGDKPLSINPLLDNSIVVKTNIEEIIPARAINMFIDDEMA